MHEQRDSALADQVADALFILARFHSERQKEYAKLDPKNPWSAEVIERERELKEAFDRYFVGMTRHRPDLDMDAAAMAPRLESWRYIADQIAGEFRAAFARANDGRLLGNSNDGPVAKFVSATIPLITREKPEPGNVAKHLKDRARGRRSSPRRPREPGQRRSRAVPVPNMRARVPDRPA